MFKSNIFNKPIVEPKVTPVKPVVQVEPKVVPTIDLKANLAVKVATLKELVSVGNPDWGKVAIADQEAKIARDLVLEEEAFRQSRGSK